MPVKTATTHQGHPRRFGRKRPVARFPQLRLKNYLTRGLPQPPQEVSYARAAMASLSNIYDNDRLGDCVIAGMAHVVGVLTGNAGTAYLYTDDEIIALYSAIGGYVPGDPNTDQGCDEQTALGYWENNGAPAGSHQIAGWLAVDATNATEVRTAMWLFENLYFGMELPDAWINPIPSASGFTWDVAGDPDPNNGHCVVGVGYDPRGVTIATWGMTGLLTDAAIARYAAQPAQGELYTVVSQDGLISATGKTPAGFDWSQLIADFDSMGGSVPTPQQLAYISARPHTVR